MRPSLTNASGTLLAFYGPARTQGLSLHQSESDLRVDLEEGGRSPKTYYVGGVFHSGELVFLAVVVNPTGTLAYLDGVLIRRLPRAEGPGEMCSGSFVVGDSPWQNDTWQGQLGGVAIYRQSRAQEQIEADRQTWARRGAPDPLGAQSVDVLYLFDEKKDGLIPDRGKSHVDLSIPERYTVARQFLLETPWRAFRPTLGYAGDVLLNVGGFIPFGAVFSVLLRSWGRTRGMGAATVIAGFLVSLAIETLQSRLPTRNSDLTDVLTNTIGAGLGFALYRNNYDVAIGFVRPFTSRSGLFPARRAVD